VKKVPGNFHISFHGKGEIAAFMGKQYSLEHSIHRLEFSESPQTGNALNGYFSELEVEEDIEYYLKLVTFIDTNIKHYKFTVYNRKYFIL
jgi:hypothetical protein